MNTIDENITMFINYYDNKFTEVTQLENKHSLFRKVIYYAIIDGLSKPIYSSEKKHRERMTSFIKDIVGWQNGGLFSLPHLYACLKMKNDICDNKLREYVDNKYSKLIAGNLYIIKQVDICLTELENITSQIETDKTSTIYKTQHYNLFYNYRNALVHELHSLCANFTNFSKYDEPYYIHFRNDDCWSLYYPEEFLSKICKQSIEKTKEYLLKENIDPFKDYTNGNYWIKELNI